MCADTMPMRKSKSKMDLFNDNLKWRIAEFIVNCPGCNSESLEFWSQVNLTVVKPLNIKMVASDIQEEYRREGFDHFIEMVKAGKAPVIPTDPNEETVTDNRLQPVTFIDLSRILSSEESDKIRFTYEEHANVFLRFFAMNRLAMDFRNDGIHINGEQLADYYIEMLWKPKECNGDKKDLAYPGGVSFNPKLGELPYHFDSSRQGTGLDGFQLPQIFEGTTFYLFPLKRNLLNLSACRKLERCIYVYGGNCEQLKQNYRLSNLIIIAVGDFEDCEEKAEAIRATERWGQVYNQSLVECSIRTEYFDQTNIDGKFLLNFEGITTTEENDQPVASPSDENGAQLSFSCT